MFTVSGIESTATRCHSTFHLCYTWCWFNHIHPETMDLFTFKWLHLIAHLCGPFHALAKRIFNCRYFCRDSCLHLLQGWVAQFRVASVITGDQGGQFESHLWQQLVQLLGTKLTRTTTYNPIVEGLIKRFHRQPKVALKCQSIPDRRINSLPMVLLGVYTAFKNDLHCSVVELVYGTTLHFPAEFFDSSSSNTLNPVTAFPQIEAGLV